MSNRAWILTVLVIATVASATRDARAMCARRTVEATAWPRGTLQPDGVMLVTVDTVGADPHRLVAAMKPSAVTLTDDTGATVAVEVELATAGRGRAQLLVRPLRPLTSGRTVALHLGDQTFEWLVEAREASAVRWTGSASVVAKSLFDGCPFFSSVTLALPLEHEAGDAVLLGLVAHGADRTVLVDYEPIGEGQVRLGYSGCSGGVLFAEDVPYHVQLAAIDSHGRSVEMPGSVSLTGPGRSDSARDGRDSFHDRTPSSAPAEIVRRVVVPPFAWYGALLVVAGLLIGTGWLGIRAFRRRGPR